MLEVLLGTCANNGKDKYLQLEKELTESDACVLIVIIKYQNVTYSTSPIQSRNLKFAN